MRPTSLLSTSLAVILALGEFTVCRSQDAKPKVIEQLSFTGATLGDVVDALRKEGGANIILAKEIRDLKAPEVIMSHVTVEGVMRAIDTAMPDILIEGQSDPGGTSYWNIIPTPSDQQKQKTIPKITRIFKASAKDKPNSAEWNDLLTKISDAARLVCEVNARAQGKPAAEFPIIEAHAATGIVIVAGTEAEVQLVGQVIQALGGEVVPLTGSVNPFGKEGTVNKLGLPSVLQGLKGELIGGKLSPEMRKGVEEKLRKSAEEARMQMEQAIKEVEQAKIQQSEAARQLGEAMKDFKLEGKPSPPKAPVPPTTEPLR